MAVKQIFYFELIEIGFCLRFAGLPGYIHICNPDYISCSLTRSRVPFAYDGLLTATTSKPACCHIFPFVSAVTRRLRNFQHFGFVSFP